MTHDQVRELLQREADDDLSPEELSLLESHLDSCAACRLEREEYQSLFLGLNTLGSLRPERSFVPDLEAEIKRAVERANQASPKPRVLPAARWRGLSVAAVAVLAVGLSVYGPLSHGTGSTGSSGNQVALHTDTGSAPVADADKPVRTDGAQTPPADAAAQAKTAAPAPGQQMAASPKTAPAPSGQNLQKQVALAPRTAASPAEGNGEAPTSEKSGASPAGTVQETGSVENAASEDKTDAPPPVAAAHPHDTSDGTTNQGIAVGVADPGKAAASAAPQVGAAPALPALNASLQSAASSGDAGVAWALDASKVVEQNLGALGFGEAATVAPTSEAGRVRVVQRGVTYEVRLDQPFQSGPQGIWRPTLIGRVIDASAPDLAERPILAYFGKSGALAGDILVTGPFADNSLPVTVDLQKNGTVETHSYLVKLKMDADGFYLLDGDPVER